MQKLVVACIYAYMTDAAGTAGAFEEHQIALLEAALADFNALGRLLLGCARQFNAILLENILRIG